MCGFKDDAHVTIPCNSFMSFFPGDLRNQKAFQERAELGILHSVNDQTAERQGN